MTKLLGYFSVLMFAGLVVSCSNTEVYEKGAKSLASLDGAMGLISREMQNTDTVQLQKAIEYFSTYRLYIKATVNDTLLPEEAELIRRFFQSGKMLEAYSKNRDLLLDRTTLMHLQLTRLRHDVTKVLISETELLVALEKERKASAELSAVMFDQQKKFYTAMQEFKQVLPLTETLIRNQNKGELPALVKQKENF